MADKFEEEYCCVLEICCGGHNKRNAKAALANKIGGALSPTGLSAKDVADWILDTFDLAPTGSLKAYRDAVAEMAREYPYIAD